MVRGVIIDLDGTLVRDGRPVPGGPEMLTRLAEAGLKIAIASNQPDAASRVASLGLHCDLILDRTSVGVSKGSGRWVESAAHHFIVPPGELIWLGDGELDMRSAVNAGIPYFHAQWSDPDYRYGFHIPSPQAFNDVVSECLMKANRWSWHIDSADKRGRPVRAFAMLDGNGAGSSDLKARILTFLHGGHASDVGRLSLANFIMLHAVGSAYLEGLCQSADTWTLYPSSKGGPNAALAPYANIIAQQFRKGYVDDLLLRHTGAPDTSLVRHKGGAVDPFTQLNTVRLNHERRAKIEGRHVVVVDDFCTDGNALECARNLLLAAGAARVTGIVLGKYGNSITVFSPDAEYRWDPYAPTTHPKEMFSLQSVSGLSNVQALADLRHSFERVRNES